MGHDYGWKIVCKDDSIVTGPTDERQMMDEVNAVLARWGYRIGQWAPWDIFCKAKDQERLYVETLACKETIAGPETKSISLPLKRLKRWCRVHPANVALTIRFVNDIMAEGNDAWKSTGLFADENMPKDGIVFRPPDDPICDETFGTFVMSW